MGSLRCPCLRLLLPPPGSPNLWGAEWERGGEAAVAGGGDAGDGWLGLYRLMACPRPAVPSSPPGRW